MVHSEIDVNSPAAVGVVSRLRALWPPACSMCFSLGLGWSTTALGNPEGGQAVAGSASIVQSSPSRLDVIQHSERAIIDWRKFSIDPAEHTNFQQPSASAAVLNRVTGGDASRILGRLTANGQVFLVNPNGVFFGRGSQVDVAGLVATTADIRNQNFLDGRYVFDKPSDKPNALVVNQGHIEVAENGFAVLAAPHVRNEGLIQARLGQVALAGANTFTLDFEGDGLLTFDVGSDVSRTPLDEEGQPVEALVSNLGTIVANGGTVVLTARAADAIVDHVINMDGVVQARAVAVRGGEIVLFGGDSGIVKVAGDIDVSGREQGQSGGTVKVLGEKVGLFDGAHIDASGDRGGGEVLIGGNLKGKGPEPNAKRTYVARDASVNADGLSEGDGGKVIVWADEVTGFNGEISARGGSDAGNGGFVEVSGKKDLSFRGEVDLTVADGDAGTLLLDPENITIVNGGPGPDDGQLNDNQILAGDSPGATFTISEQALEALPNSEVVLEATNDITIEDLADNELLFAAGPGGSITFTVGLDGSFVMNSGDTIRASGRDVTVSPAAAGGTTDAAIGTIDTSNIAGGGRIDVGPFFDNITLGTLDSSSVSGNGGEVLVRSVQSLIINGGIDAAGSPDGGDIVLVGNEIDLAGLAGSVRANNAELRILPFTFQQNTIIGGTENTTGALDLTSSDLDALAEGFSNVRIGSSDSGGSQGQITVLSDTFPDLLTFNNPLTLAGNSINLIGDIGTNGNPVSMTAVDIDTTAGRLFSSSDNGSGGAITLTTQDGNIATGDLFSRATSSIGDGGDITLIVNGAGGAIDTTAGSLISTSANGTGGAITLTTGDGNIGGNISTGTLASRGDGIGDGGDITLTVDGAGGFIEVIDPTVDTFSSGSSNGNGGAITLTTGNGSIGGNISTGRLSSGSSLTGNTADGGDITVTIDGSIGSIDTTAGISSSSGVAAGAITLTTAGGNISTADVFSVGGLDSTGAGGDITITIDGPTGSIDTTAGQQVNSGGRRVGGAITLSTQSGDIATNRIESGGFFGVGGAITLSTQGGNISTSALLSVGGSGDSGDTNAGGDITLTINGPTGSINTTAEGLLHIDSSSFNDVGGAITLRTEDGDIDVTNQMLSDGQVNGGEISIVSSSGSISIADQILATGVDGVGGAVILETNGGIAAGAINSTGGAGSGDISLVGEEIDLLGGAGSVQATNASLSLQPFIAETNIVVGGLDNDTEALDLTSEDLAALADGFASITIGRNDGRGTISIDPAGISLNDPLILQSPATGGIIDANGPIQTSGSLRATAPTIGLQDVSSNDFQNYTGSVTFNSDYVTGGGSFTVEGDSTLASDTTVTTDGGDVLFGGLEGPGKLTITAGSGDILFQGDVGAQIPLGVFSVASAQNVTLGGQFIAGPSEFFYDGSLTSPDPSLEVESLSIDPDATSATLFGSVGGASGREAALAVEGPSGDPDFTINGFVMGTSEPEVVAEPGGLTAAEPNTNTAEEIAVAKQDVFVAEEPSPEPELKTELAPFEPAVVPVRFPPKFSMSNFTMNATIKGGWPLVVDYQLERPGEVRVNIAVEGVEHFTFELDGTTTDRKWDVVTVPKRFGVRVKPASITVRASEQGGTKAVPLHLYGLGAGDKAVGSVAIDSILFGPTRINTFFGETAAYRFRSRSDFDTVKVDFCKVTDTAYENTNESVHTHDIEQGISGHDWIGLHEPRIWNGRDRKNAVSSGLHKLQVRAWDKPGEWVTAWSDSLLDVSE